MKTLKLTITTLLIIQSLFLFAQKNYKFISKDLHQMTDKEMVENQVEISGDVIMYTADGNTIEPSQINDIMASGNFFPVVYGNKSHKAKAIVFRATTKEEKKEMRAAMQAQMNDPNAHFEAGKMAKDFEATTINGSKISLNKLKGKIVVLNFWFTTCPPCVAEIPELNKLTDKYKDVEFISITFETKEKVQKFLKQHKFNFKHIVKNNPILADYGVSAFPTSIIIDQKGEIIFRKVGTFIKEMNAKLELLQK